MASKTTKSPKIEKKTQEKNSLETFTRTVVLNMSRGKFFCPVSKETKTKGGEEKKTMTTTHKEISGIKASLKKEALFSELYKAEVTRAEAEAVANDENKANYTKYIQPEAFATQDLIMDIDASEDPEAAAEEMSKQFVYVPALGLCGTIRAISVYIQGHVLSYTNNRDLNKYASRLIAKYLIHLMAQQSSYVVSIANLGYSRDAKEVVLRGDLRLNPDLYNKSNISADALDKLSHQGEQAAHRLADRFRDFLSACGEDYELPAEWWNTPVDTHAVQQLFRDATTTLGFDKLPKKADHEFAELPTVQKKITHDNFLRFCAQVGAFTTISLSKVPKELIVEAKHKDAEDKKRRQVVYTFCDMNDPDEASRYALSFPLKIDGVTSVSEGKTSTGKKASTSGEKDPVGYILNKYIEDAKIDQNGEMPSEETVFDEIVTGNREMDVTKDFITSDGAASGFRCTKCTKTHSIMFSNTEEISRDTILTLWRKQAEGEYDSDFWQLFTNLLMRTVKISATRGSQKDGSVAESAQDRTRKFFEIVLRGSDIKVADVMSLFTVRGRGNADVDM